METTLTAHPGTGLNDEQISTDTISALPDDQNASGQTSTHQENSSFPHNLTGDARIKALRAYILERLDDEKAENITTIDLAGKSEIADTMIIASGRSARHVGALAHKVQLAFKEAGVLDSKIEGQPACDWVLLDAGDIIVHMFRPEVREFYNLERIWSEAARAPVSAEQSPSEHPASSES